MNPDTHSIISNETVTLLPLEQNDFEIMYNVASDPKIWEQHPNKDRWRREVFEIFFKGAIESNGAYKIIDNDTNAIVGCTRIYDYNEETNSVLIGYTFMACKYWGTGVNHIVKKLLLNHLFKFVDHVHFHIGAQNIRSQVSITRLGALKIDEVEVAYYGEPVKHNFVYRISKSDFPKAT
jgi:RimJ/RimL family protein N-acetyltransferase